MKSKNRKWIFAWAVFLSILQLILCEIIYPMEANNSSQPNTDTAPNTTELRGLISPRMDYDEWTPLGEANPLNNEPTYMYAPPLLDRVNYWIPTEFRKPDPPIATEKDVSVLANSSYKSPSDPTEQKSQNRYIDFDDNQQFINSNNNQRIFETAYPIAASYFSSFYRPRFSGKNEQNVPNTMLLPPPMPSKKPPTTISVGITKRPVSASSVSIEQSNLIYQSSSVLPNGWDGDKYATSADASSLVTWKTPLPTGDGANYKKANHNSDVVEKTMNASYNQINNVDPKQSFDAGVVGGKNAMPEGNGMHKGLVSNVDMDISSSYVNIIKSNAQVDLPSGMGISGVTITPPKLAKIPPYAMDNVNLAEMNRPMGATTLQMLQTMQTMQPPPVSVSPIFTKPSVLHSILSKEKNMQLPPIKMPSSMLSMVVTSTTSTTPSPTTTTTSSLTTDPLFKHYKQQQIHGPMYMIIQGHSKVITYGPAKQIHGLMVQDTNEIPTSDEFSVKHLHNYRKEGNDLVRAREGRSSDLQTLSHVVQTGLGAIEFAEIPANRRNGDVQETELEVGYDVSARKETGEKYYKGTVEAGVLARKMHDYKQ